MYKNVIKYKEFESWEDTIKYIDDAESWDIVQDLMENCCEALGIDSSEFDDPDFLFEDIKIHSGCAHELTKEQIEFYKKAEFNGWVRTEIYMGFQDGLTIEQIKLYAKPKFNRSQMQEIREGFKSGLSKEQVQMYAKPKFDYEQMYEIRKGLEQRYKLIDENTENIIEINQTKRSRGR